MDGEKIDEPGAGKGKDNRLDFFSRGFDAAFAFSIQSLQPPNPKACTLESHQTENHSMTGTCGMWQSRVASNIHIALRSSGCVCLHLTHHQQGMHLEKVKVILASPCLSNLAWIRWLTVNFTCSAFQFVLFEAVLEYVAITSKHQSAEVARER